MCALVTGVQTGARPICRDDLARLETRHDLDATGAALADGDLLGPEAVVRPHEDHIAAFEGLKRLIGDNDPGGTARLGTTAREEPHADRTAWLERAGHIEHGGRRAREHGRETWGGRGSEDV